jgi:hypothetical protein
MKIELGSEVTDKVSGFTGIATARVEYINGCTQYCVTPKCVDNKPAGSEYFDHAQLDVSGDGVIVNPSDTGGPSRYQPRS